MVRGLVGYLTIAGFGEDETTIKKSRFIGRATPISSEEDALAWIAEIKANERDATHHCSCYILGDNQMTQRFNDDGEPQGTAGIPMLEVLKKENLTNLAVVVTRYYGGIKLGASGLIRAYGAGCKSAIDAAGIVKMTPCYIVRFVVSYPLIGKIDYILRTEEYVEVERTFEAEVTITLHIPVDQYGGFVARMDEETSKTASIEIVEEILLPFAVEA